MKTRILYALLILLLASLPGISRADGCRPKPFRGAGVLPYAKVDGRTLVLLGYEAGRGWSGFGGKPMLVSSLDVPEPRCETYPETAAREGAEELRRMLGYRQVLAAIDTVRYFPESAAPEDFRSYTIKIPHIGAAEFRQMPIPAGSDFDEMDDYYWIDLNELARIVNAGDARLPQSPNAGRLWETALGDLKEALGSAVRRGELFP